MKIRGIFCCTTAANNEEYRKVLKKRNVWMAALAVAGIMIAAAALVAEHSGASALPEYILGVYCGFGTGLAIAGIIVFVRNMILLGNEAKLKMNRLENTDERLMEIGSRAGKTAIKVVLLVGTASAMICGIYEPVLIKAMLFMLDVFLFSYITAYAYHKHKI
ncbi:MAG: hypothetical protein K2O16_03800 [Lachnospiraceae bacterium]|nr:hypothetical protein [Lachnospiraceae bacterium]